MKIFSTLTIALLIIFQAVGFAATGTFSASGEYTMSDYDTTRPKLPSYALWITPAGMPPSKQASTWKVIRAQSIPR